MRTTGAMKETFIGIVIEECGHSQNLQKQEESEGSALLAPAGLGQGLGRCTLQRSASQGQSKGEVGREYERG